MTHAHVENGMVEIGSFTQEQPNVFRVNSGWGCVCAKCVLSRFSRVWLFATLLTIAHQAPLSMGFSRQEYWSGLSCPPPGDLPDPGIQPVSLPPPALAGGFFSRSTSWGGDGGGWTEQWLSRGGCRKGPILGISLVVHWLRLYAPNAGGPGSIPGQGTRSNMPQLKEPAHHNQDQGSHVPELRPGTAN